MRAMQRNRDCQDCQDGFCKLYYSYHSYYSHDDDLAVPACGAVQRASAGGGGAGGGGGVQILLRRVGIRLHVETHNMVRLRHGTPHQSPGRIARGACLSVAHRAQVQQA